MEKNTAILDIKRYNYLLNLETKLNEGKILVDYNQFNEHISYFTESEIIDSLIKDKKELREEISELQKEQKYLDKVEEICKEREKRIKAEIKKMNFWQFRKWRKQSLRQ